MIRTLLCGLAAAALLAAPAHAAGGLYDNGLVTHPQSGPFTDASQIALTTSSQTVLSACSATASGASETAYTGGGTVPPTGCTSGARGYIGFCNTSASAVIWYNFGAPAAANASGSWQMVAGSCFFAESSSLTDQAINALSVPAGATYGLKAR